VNSGAPKGKAVCAQLVALISFVILSAINKHATLFGINMHVNIGSYYSYETIYVCMKNVLENSFDKRSLLYHTVP
jgi:hypothetical protein